ncbi:uncharacterized protein LOC134535956 isoform X2 [Bacillus rossius redtenbacheri]|uniref:uncharacterized protein LOC134535956 isoform X2 n=1 Tax=Bacillus rossius redtenbacheri TaxID=93214 RepID=UPI002FDED1AF
MLSGALVLLLVAAGAAVAAGEQDAAACPPHDSARSRPRYLPHPGDCAMFLRCHGGQGVPGRCPPGTAFLRADAACGDPRRSDCASPSSPPSSTTAGCAPGGGCGYRCSCRRAAGASCPARVAFPARLRVTRPGCPRGDGTFPLLGGGRGRVEPAPGASTFSVSSCPEGLPAGRSVVPHFADCSRVFLCVDGREESSECPAGFLFSPDTGFCEESRLVNCSAPNEVHPTAEGCPPEAALLECRYSCDCAGDPGGRDENCPPRLGLRYRLRIFDTNRNPACLREEGATSLGDQYVATGDVERGSAAALYCPAESSRGRPVYLPHPADRGSFIACYRGAQSVRTCPAGWRFDPTTRRCVRDEGGPFSLSSSSSSSHQRRCPTTWVCSAAYRGVPHISDCTLFCRCDGTRPVLAACPPGSHFSPRSQTCEDPVVASCRPTCAQLGDLNGSGGEDRGSWQPRSCVDGDSALGARCRLRCLRGYELDGSVRVRCTRRGWASSGVLDVIPACRTPEEIGSDLIKKINESLIEIGNRQTEMLFIIDDANRITAPQLEIQKHLVASIVRTFPLSQRRVAGVATLGDARVYIRLIRATTCDFLAELRSVGRAAAPGAGGGGGGRRAPDVTEALRAAEAEVDRRGSASRALIFLITSKRTRTKPLPAADELKNGRHVLFTIGVGKYNRKQLSSAASRHRDGSKLFFGLSSVKSVKRMVGHVAREYSTEEANYCF